MSTVLNPPEQRVVLRNVSWETYERLLEENPESRSPRFTYDDGDLERVAQSLAFSNSAALLRESSYISLLRNGDATRPRGAPVGFDTDGNVLSLSRRV